MWEIGRVEREGGGTEKKRGEVRKETKEGRRDGDTGWKGMGQRDGRSGLKRGEVDETSKRYVEGRQNERG